jgi:chemotaxis protein methyltransferase CheR
MDGELNQVIATVAERAGVALGGRQAAAVRQRLADHAAALGMNGDELAERLRAQESAVDEALAAARSPPAPPFADVELWRALREQVVPVLRTFPRVRAWVLGCGTGDDALALAVMFEEEGLLGRGRIYATDVAEGLLARARAAALPADVLRAAHEPYRAAGGRAQLADHFEVADGRAALRPALRDRLLFAAHNPAADGSLNEFHLVLCRDVLSALDAEQEGRGYRLVGESLCRFGTLALGATDELPADQAGAYERCEGSARLYRRVR